MSKSVIGIDPGMTGALCFYSAMEKITYEMPTYDVMKNGGKRKKINTQGVLEILRFCRPEHIFIEQVSAQPGNGAAAAFTYGFGAGVLEACVASCGIPFTYVLPQVWKKELNCPKDKNAARVRASQLIPELSHNWSLKRQDGVAEAALIALYGFRKMGY